MKHIPNLLSIFRIALIPLFVSQMATGHTLTAGLILVLSGLTDFFDGQLARRFGWVTPVGKILDPVADKLTQTAVSITLMVLLRQYWPFFAIMLAKDCIMLVLGGWLMRRGVKLEGARWFGKVSTFLYYAVMILIILIPSLPAWLTLTLLVLATACALISALLYIPVWRRYRREAKGQAAPEPPEESTPA